MSDETTNKISLVNLPDMPGSVDNALTNLTDCPTKNAGQTFGDLWYLVFGGITQAADKKRMKYAADLEKYHQELDKSITSIPEDKKIEPSIQVTAQALENSKYCVSSEALRSIFVKLISGTMNSYFEPLVHPSFPEMIKQMNEHDAHLLMELKRKSRSVPIAEFRETFKENDGFVTHFTNAYISDLLQIPLTECSCALSSLKRMGLITLSYDEYFTNDSVYDPFYETVTYKNLSKEIDSYKNNSEITLQKGICSITPLGNRFIGACVL